MRYQPTRSCGIAETFWLGAAPAGYARDTPYEIHRLVLIAVSKEGRDAGQQAVAPAVGRSLRADPALPARHLLRLGQRGAALARGRARRTGYRHGDHLYRSRAGPALPGHLRRPGLHRRAGDP